MPIEQRRGAVPLALIATFMVFVDGTIVNLALAQLAVHLHASRSELEWAVNAYTLSFAAVMLGAGALVDSVGAKRAFVAGLAVFTTASGVCAAAGSMALLDVARLVQGAGAALLLPSALVLATASAHDDGARHRLVGWWGAAGGAGMASGPVLGGALIALAGWPAIFAVNVVLGVPALLWSIRSMPSTRGRKRRLDVSGQASATLLIGGVVYALIEAPAVGWTNPRVMAAVAAAIVGLGGFIAAERTSPAPLLPLGVYRNLVFVGVSAQGALFNFAFYGVLFALGLVLQQGRGIDALSSGLLFLPLTGLLSIANLTAAPLSRRLGRPTLMALAQTALTLSLLLGAWASTSTALWPLILTLVPVGFASGMLVPTMTSQALATVPPELHGAASAAFNTSRQVGAAIGVAVFAPLLTSQGSLDHGPEALDHGFALGLTIAAIATAATLTLTPLTQRTRTTRALTTASQPE